MIENKKCNKCNIHKPIHEFDCQRSNADGKRKYCKSCRRQYAETFKKKVKKEKDWFEQFSPI